MATPHISALENQIAPIVIMPGDPLRAKFIAEKYLKNTQQINILRNMLGWTGSYNGKLVTVMASGMGCPSMGIYSFELFKFYNVQKIIRIGTCGSYKKELNVKDLVIAEKIISKSSYLKQFSHDFKIENLGPSASLVKQINNLAKNKNLIIKNVTANCADVFYSQIPNNWKKMAKKADVVEMETLALYANAYFFQREAACILTVSDSFVNGKSMSGEEREHSLLDMISLALELK